MANASLAKPLPATPGRKFLGMFCPRGPLSAELMEVLTGRLSPEDADFEALGQRAAQGVDVFEDDDVQLALFILYSLAYGSFDQFGAEWEWSSDLIRLRTKLERVLEGAVRDRVKVPARPPATAADVAEALFALTAPAPGGPAMARYAAKHASLEQLREFLIHRTLYTLRESDPHSWAIPRLTGRAKAALVEIQSDEYGAGDPDRVHATIFARTLRNLGLNDRYGYYLDHIPAITLAAHNLVSMFGLNRRLRGALIGHLAAFEMPSSIPSGLYADAFRRHGFGSEVTWYFDEHVEADAVHEQIAGHDLAGSLAEDEPHLLPDIMFGAAACMAVEGWVGEYILTRWQAGRSALRDPATGGSDE